MVLEARLPIGACVSQLEQHSPTRSRALFMARAVALYAGDIPRCFHRLSPLCGFPQWHPPQRTMSPRATAHTGHQMCADTVSPPSCLPHPDPLAALAFSDRELAAARPTWTATHAACTSARACRCSASFAWCAALPSSSPSKPSALDHTDAAHPKCERSHSLFHPASPSVPLARAHRNLGCSKKALW